MIRMHVLILKIIYTKHVKNIKITGNEKSEGRNYTQLLQDSQLQENIKQWLVKIR